MKRSLYILVLFFQLAGIRQAANAQWEWTELIRFPRHIACVYFIPNSTTVAFAGLAHGQLWKTVDRGQTWMQTLQTSDLNSIVDITFKNDLVGWLAVGWGGCYKTTNGGQSWLRLPSPLGISGIRLNSVYYHGPSKLLLLASDEGILTSTDDGASWQQQLSTRDCAGFAFSDSLHGVNASPDVGAEIVVTKDGGFTWGLADSTSSFTTFQPTAFYGTSFFFAAPYVSLADENCFRSFNYGTSWEWVAMNVHEQSTHVARADDCFKHLYIQGSGSLQGGGLDCSADSGKTWLNIGGPDPDVTHLRFCVNAHEVFAFDQQYLFKGVNKQVEIVQFSQNSLSFRQLPCLYSDSIITITNRNCDVIEIDSFWLSGSSAFIILSPTTRKILIPPDSTVSFHIRFQGNASQLYKGQLHVELSTSVLERTLLFPLDGYGMVRNQRLISDSLKLKSISICRVVDTSVVLTIIFTVRR